ncbi:hypothetical protein HDU86_001945 [Geranomyces michiganensis]|nr:hypothetical protein HDU86_001945 [Geranomyces michiganensis]
MPARPPATTPAASRQHDSSLSLRKSASLPPHSLNAQFATCSRLLAALVNEALCTATMTAPLCASLYPLNNQAASAAAAAAPVVTVRFSHLPTLAGNRVTFIDPADIAPLGISQMDPVRLFDLLVVAEPASSSTDAECIARLRRELRSSVDCYTQLLADRRSCKPPSLLTSSAIDWEQAIVEGHATHPMHRSRTPLDKDTRAAMGKNPNNAFQMLARPTITFVSVPRSAMNMNGPYDDLLASYLPRESDPTRVVVPVHQVQLPQVLRRFPFAKHIPDDGSTTIRHAIAQASMRTVCPDPANELSGYHIKLPVAIYTTSALRTISPHSVRNGPIVSELALRVVKDPSVLHVIREVASIGASMEDNAVSEHDAKHLACIIRSDPELELPHEKLIIAAALVERNAPSASGAEGATTTTQPLVISAFHLHTRESRIEFLETYTRLAVDAFLPPMLEHGFGFECHGQNTLLRVCARTGKLLGFAIRDFGGVQIHVPTLARSLGIKYDDSNNNSNNNESPSSPLLAFHDASSIIVSQLEQVYVNVFHCLVQNQLHRLVRALDLHHCGTGWEIVRRHVSRWINNNNTTAAAAAARRVWFGETVELKAFVRMKMGALYRDYLYSTVPNVLLHGREEREREGEGEEAREGAAADDRAGSESDASR